LTDSSGSYHVYVDESGDLGFGRKSTEFFVVAYAITSNRYPIERGILRLKKKFNTRWKGFISEFKYSNDDDDTKDRVFSAIQGLDFDLGYVAIRKSYVAARLRSAPLLYRYFVVNNIITDLVHGYDVNDLTVTVDKSLPRQGMEEFNRYLADKLTWRQVVEKGDEMPTFRVHHLQSDGEPGLQVADYCSGAAFSYFERGNPGCYDLLRPKIRFRNPSWGNISW
jgi:hypothetical protein